MAKFLYSRVHHKPNNKLATFLMSVFLFLIITAGVLIYNYLMFSPRDRVVKEYLSALKTKNLTKLENMVAPEYDAKSYLQKDIEEIGGLSFAINLGYKANPENGLAVDATLIGLKGIKPFKRTVTLIGQEEAWYLKTGNLKEEYK